MLSLMLLGEELGIMVTLRFIEETCQISKALKREKIFYLSSKSIHKLVLQERGKHVKDWDRFYFFAKIDDLTSVCPPWFFCREWASKYVRHPVGNPFPRHFLENIARIREAGTLKCPEVQENRLRKFKAHLANKSFTYVQRIAEERSEPKREEMIPPSVFVPSLVDRLKKKLPAAQSSARSENEPNRAQEEEKRREDTRRQAQAKKASSSKPDGQIVESRRTSSKTRTSRDDIAAGKKHHKSSKRDGSKTAREKQKKTSRLAIEESEADDEQPLIRKKRLAEDAENEQSSSRNKRSAEDVDLTAPEMAVAKKVRTAEACSADFASGSVLLIENPRGCADLCKGVGGSSEPLPEFAQMDEEEVFERYAQSTIKAMTAINELFGRLQRGKASVEAEQSNRNKLEGAVLDATSLYNAKKARATFLGIELANVKADHAVVSSELERLRAENKDLHLEAVNNEYALNTELSAIKKENAELLDKEKSSSLELEGLRKENAELKAAYSREQRRLRRSREACVNAEKEKNERLRANCQHIFDKVKAYKASEDSRLLYGQAKGVRETLEYLQGLGTVVVPAETIAELVVEEAELLKEYQDAGVIQLDESELIVHDGVEEIPLEGRAHVAAYESNEGAINPDKAQELKDIVVGTEGDEQLVGEAVEERLADEETKEQLEGEVAEEQLVGEEAEE